MRVTAALAGSILVINVVLGRSVLESVLFALAIAVGLTPQLLPAIVTVSLSTGAKRLAERAVIVKRLVSIEDLGNIDVLFTDKTGTLTDGQITFAAALDPAGQPSDATLLAGLLCNDATVAGGVPIGGNQLDRALWAAPGAADTGTDRSRRIADLPFDHRRRLASVLVEEGRATPHRRQGRARGGSRALRRRSRASAGGARRPVRDRRPCDRSRDPRSAGPHDVEHRR